MDDELAFYAAPGRLTALPADVGDVPWDPAGLRAVVPGLMVHTAWVTHYGLSAPTIDARQTRTATETIGAIRALADRPLTAARAPVDRVGTVCRHFSAVSVAMLRNAGVPARARCGFATYFEPGKYIDHWIVEYHDGARWVRSDYQLDQLQREMLATDFDPDDLPEGSFVDAGEAWRRIRAGEADPETFGIFEFWGAWFVRANVWRDLASLNKLELLPWDEWGPVHKAPDEFVDEVAALAREGAFDARRTRYLGEKALRVPRRVLSYTPAGPRKERVPTG